MHYVEPTREDTNDEDEFRNFHARISASNAQKYKNNQGDDTTEDIHSEF